MKTSNIQTQRAYSRSYVLKSKIGSVQFYQQIRTILKRGEHCRTFCGAINYLWWALGYSHNNG
jgi:hypothetical protein